MTLLAVDKTADHQILPGPLRRRILGYDYLRCCFCVIFLSDLIYLIVIKHKWSQQWNLWKIVLSQDMFVFDLVNKQGFISLKRKKKKSNSIKCHRYFCQVKTLSHLSVFAYQFFQPGIHRFPLCLSSFGARLPWHFHLRAFPVLLWLLSPHNPSFPCTCKYFYAF